MSTPDDKKIYTAGYSPTAIQSRARRNAAENAGFFLPHLRAGMHVLDCGCGPGNITIGLAAVVAPGEVVGIDIEPSQIDLARTQAAQRGCTNIRFDVGNVLQLPYPEATFDSVFGHTILMQFQDPLPVLAEVCRVVKPGGVVGFREPACHGNLYAPPEGAYKQYFALFMRMLQHNGSNPLVGHRLSALLSHAGLERVTMSASYEGRGSPEEKQERYDRMARRCHEDGWMEQAIALGWISRDARDRLSAALRVEGADPEAFSAFACCEGVGWKAGHTMV
jgi:ubiquinone/menaquinone biosynthesis C-methylase UbiE